MEDKHRTGGPTVGASSLLVIFAVLCLTVFTLLALSTAQASGRLARRSAQAVEDYYAADCAAEALLARLRAGETPPEVTVQEEVCTYACPITDNQVLEVAVRLEEDGGYTVLRWQAVSTQEWAPDQSLEVWDGQLPAE